MVLKVKKFLRETVFCHRKYPLNANKMQVYKDLSFVSIFIRRRIPQNRHNKSVLVNFKNHAGESFTTLQTLLCINALGKHQENLFANVEIGMHL